MEEINYNFLYLQKRKLFQIISNTTLITLIKQRNCFIIAF